MRKLFGLVGLAVVLTACGGSNSPGKSQDEAVEDFREQVGVTSEVSDEEIRGLMWEACNVLDDNRPGAVVDELSEYPRVLVTVVLDNATQAFCPEHRLVVRQYLAD